jgi:predicted small integral membrane protein
MNNLNAIRLNNSTNDNSVDKKFYYGRVFQKDNTGKLFDFMVTNHMEEGKKYKFRYTSKCKAGFVTICETNYETTPEQFIGSTYGFLENVQVWIESENPTDTHKGIWLNVLTTKGKKFYSIDKNFLLNLKVGNIHNAWKKMVDFDLWKRMESKTHADYAYKMNNVATEEVAA